MLTRAESPRREITNALDGLLESCEDPSVFGDHFQDASWNAWRSLTTALARRPLSPPRKRSSRPARATARP
jgi:hypothetical protein